METGVNSDILGYLKKRQSELEKVSHPMVRYDDSFRYLYAFGLGVMALESNERTSGVFRVIVSKIMYLRKRKRADNNRYK